MTRWHPARLRGHRPFLVLLLLGTALRVATMVAYRPAIYYIDSIASYLVPLPTLDPTGQDPIGYDILLLRPILAIGDITTVAIVQHLLGLGMAVAGYLLLRHKGAGRWLAALATAPVLLDAYQVQIEHNLMSDPLFEALIVGALVVLAWPARPGWAHVSVAGVLIGASATVREVGEVLLVPLILYALILGGRRLRRVGLAVASIVAFVLPVAGYVGYFHSYTGRFAISNAGGNALYGRIATFADCTGLVLPDQEQILCPAQPVDERQGTDFWAHDPSSPYFVLRDQRGTTRADQLASDFAKRIIKHQPVDFAAAVAADAAKVLPWTRGDRSTGDPTVERWRFQRAYPTFPSLVTIDSVSGLNHQYGSGDPVAVGSVATFLRDYQLSVGYTPGPVLAIAMLLGLVAVVRRGRRTPAGPVALLFLGTGLLVLLAGDVVVFSWRYQLPGFVLIPLAGALGVAAVLRPAPARPFPEAADQAAIATLDPDLVFPPVVVLIAAYNESEALGPVLDSVPKMSCGQDVAPLVVVDGATDGTADVARAHGAVTCVVPVNRGQGAALRLGYHVAATRGARYIVTTDADGQYDLAELPLLLEPLLRDEADFVTGSRQLGANESTDPVRRLGTRVFATLVSVLTGHKVTDTSFGFRGMRAEVPASITLNQPQYQSSELLVGVLSHGYRVLERPMTMRRRGNGHSKKGNNLIYGLRYTRVVLGTWWRERNTTLSSTTNLTTKKTA